MWRQISLQTNGLFTPGAKQQQKKVKHCRQKTKMKREGKISQAVWSWTGHTNNETMQTKGPKQKQVTVRSYQEQNKSK